jgi:hypothetical protein
MAVEDYFTWVWAEGPGAWFHGNGKARIDVVEDHYVISYRRVGRDGYYWETFYTCPTLGAAKVLAETAFTNQKRKVA